MAGPQFAPAVHGRLLEWFAKNSRQADIEIEARIKGVTHAGFEAVRARLMSGTWSNTPKLTRTIDLIHQTGVRESRDADGSRTFLRKDKLTDMMVGSNSPHDVRFALARERCASAPLARATPRARR